MLSVNIYKFFLWNLTFIVYNIGFQFYKVLNDFFLFSIKPILFLHYLLVLKTEEQDKSILCMCVYILCICIQYVISFVGKIVLRCVDIWVYTYTVVWLCVCCEGQFWRWNMPDSNYLIQYSCYSCICQFSLKCVSYKWKMLGAV